MDEFKAPTAPHGPSREITPAFIMDLFPHVHVVRNIQGNGYTLSALNPTAKRWQFVAAVNDTTRALSFAASLS